MNVISFKKLIKVVLVLVALVVLLINFGEPVQPPYPLSFTVTDNNDIGKSNYHNTLFKEGIGGVTIDEGFTRVIFLNKDKEASAHINTKIFDSSVRYFCDAALDDKYVYLLSYERYADTDYIKNQKITKYDYQGNQVSTIWKKEYDSEKSSILNPRIFSLDDDQKNIYAIYVDENEKFADVINVSSGSDKVIAHFVIGAEGTIYSVQYNDKTNSLGILTDLSNFQLYKDNRLVSTQSKCGFDKEFIKLNDDGSYQLLTSNPRVIEELHKVDFSAILILKTLLFWASLIFIIVYAIKKIIDVIKKLLKEKKTKSIVRGAGISVAAILILGLSVYYSFYLVNSEINNRINELTLTVKNSAFFMKDDIDKNLNSLNDKSDYLRLKNELFTLRKNNLDAKQNMEFSLLYHDKGELNSSVILASTYPGMRLGKSYSLNSSMDVVSAVKNNKFLVHSLKANKGESLLVQQVISSQNSKPMVSLCISSDVLSIESKLLDNIVFLFVNLLVIIVAIVLMCGEIGGIYSSIKLRNKLRLSRARNPEIGLSRTFAFLSTFVTSFDGALMVLITKDIITQNNMSNSALLLGIPATCLSVGITLGKPIFNITARHFNIKFIVAINSICLAVTYYFCFRFVAASNFYGYSIAILASGVFTGAITAIKYYMPLLSPNNKVRFDINQKYALTGISGNVISVALSGIIVDMLGSQYIYVMAIIPSLMLLLLGILVFPKDKKYYMMTKDTGKTKIKNGLKFFFHPAFLTFVLFILFSAVLATGYKTFLFPLFTSDAGISKAMISNYFVMGNFLAFIVNRLSKKSIKKYDFLTITVFCTITVGIVFLSFLINSTVAWSVVVIAIIMALSKINEMCCVMLWPRLCKRMNFSEQSCNKAILYLNDIGYMSRSVIMSELITMGIKEVCITLGVFTVVGAVIFLVVAKTTGKFNPIEKKES